MCLDALRSEIRDKLSPLIVGDYVFLGLPYYSNIGDALIWKGTEFYLDTLPYKCLYRCSIETFIEPGISDDVTILLQGGGNFGDLWWRIHTEFRLDIIKKYPRNKIVILPQTIFYEDKLLLMKDASVMASHPNLSICVRDTNSYNILKEYFPCDRILLVPDMAFYIPDSFIVRWGSDVRITEERTLFLKRDDSEFKTISYEKYVPMYVETYDWPSVENKNFKYYILIILKKILNQFKGYGIIKRLISRILDFYAIHIYMPSIIKLGISFISEYDCVYTTRLHGSILSLLLKKRITLFDNSYGKNAFFYETWLKHIKSIRFMSD